ncbi:MAG: hypothetical protein MK082_05745 [Phycisphaerales bacterium]|nr:hypothetical protein [Phycisphaerales bacterium]
MSGTTSKTLHADVRRAEKALESGDFFEAERLALAALEEARSASEFKVMTDIIPTLRDARSARLEAAIEAGESILHLEKRPEEGESVEPGCYLVQPPLVGADARALRLAALEQGVPVATVCREPLTETKLRPIVAIGRITVRARVLPAADDASPDMEWFLTAMNELGETAIESVDTGTLIIKQIDALLDRLDSIPDHARLHDALEEICMIAASSEQPDG